MSEWGAPQNLTWFWVLPGAVVLFVLASIRARLQMKRFGDILMIQKLVSSLSPLRRWMKRLLVLLALASLVTALCQPHFSKKEVTIDRSGVDVVIALDVSRSMLAKDMPPNRLEKAKLELTDLIEKLKGDRIGIVAFAGEAIIVCPLTFDKSAIKLFLTTAHPNLIPRQGTAIARAIHVATLAFADKDASDKVMILLTDGEDHEEDPREAARAAKKANIKIYGIGFGTNEGSTVPLGAAGEGFKKDRQGQVVISKINETILKAVAQETDGVYYRSSRGEIETSRIASDIRRMSQKGYGKRKSIEYEENFQLFTGLALILLCLELCLSERKRPIGKSSAMVLILLMTPFLFGFSFFSPVKNEEGNRYYKKGQVGKAKKAYLEAHEMDPESPVVSYNLGNTYYKEEAYENSLDAYKRAAQEIKDPGMQSGAFYNLGNTLVRKGDKAKAIDFYKQALRLNPRDVDAKFNLELLMKQPPQPQPPQKKDEKKDQQEQNQQNNKDDQSKDNQQNQDKNQENKEDQKNQQDQKDRQDQENKQDQKNDSQNQQNKNQEDKQDEPKKEDGQSGEKDQEKPQDQKGEQKPQDGEGEQDPKDSKGEQKEQDKPSQNGQNGQEPKDEKGPDSKEPKEPKEPSQEQKPQDKGGSEGEDEKEPKGSPGQQPQEGEESEGDETEKPEPAAPKSDAEKRAEQILNALENQERQVLKLQSGQNKPMRNIPVVNEKDW